MEKTEFLVAEEQNRIVGLGVLDVEKSLVNAVYVDPSYVKKSVGRRLVGALEEIARTKNVTELRLNSTLNAVPFYEALGYSHGKIPVTRLPNGTELPCVAMAKRLA